MSANFRHSDQRVSLNVQVIVTDPELYADGLPQHATPGSAAVDLKADDTVEIPPYSHVIVGTGLRIWVQHPNYAAFIFARSGAGSRGLVLGNGTGVIDADYQGPLCLTLYNRTGIPMTVRRGDRVAQMAILPVFAVQWEPVTEFHSDTERGVGGFGSTGV